MHGCSSGSALLVNAEVDSMGGVVDGGVGIGIKTSPRRAAIEKAQAELRQEYDVREERRKELEFLEKGGNPLDFKFTNAASVSVQSTSLTDHHHAEQFVTSEAKGSFPLTASPHGDSVESSGRPGATGVCEPNSADNFDGENELLEVERKPKHANRRNSIIPLEHSSQMDGTQNAKESEDSAIFRPYARRNRSKPHRDGARSSSADIVQNSAGHGSSLPVRGGSRDAKGPVTETDNQKDQITASVSNLKSTTSNGEMVPQIDNSNAQSNMEIDGTQTLEKEANLPEHRLDVSDSNVLGDNQHAQLPIADHQKAPSDVATGECDHVGGKEQVISAGPECPPCAPSERTENETGSTMLNGFSDLKRDGNGNESQNGNTAMGPKGLDSESSCTQNSLSLDINNDSDLCANRSNSDNNVITMKESSEFEGTQNLPSGKMGNEKKENKVTDCGAAINDIHGSLHQNYSGNGSSTKNEEETKGSCHLQNEVKCPNHEGVEQNDHVASDANAKVASTLADDSNSNKEKIYPSGSQGAVDLSIHNLPEPILSEKNSAAPDLQSSFGGHLKLPDKAHEDSILEEARIIEAKRKRISQLSVGTVPSECRRKSHWDFVLEEMAWLANDFAQEHLWKMTAASQICRRVAFTSQLRVGEQNQLSELKKVAYSLAKAVMQFWHSAEVLVSDNDQSGGPKNCKNESRMFDGNEFSVDKFGEIDKSSRKELELQNSSKNVRPIHGYAVRFLKFNSSPVPSLQAEAPATPDRIADFGTMDISWDDRLTEESLFYAVPSGAMETYRMSIESHIVQSEKARDGMQEEVDTPFYGTPADFGYADNGYDEEEGETSAYYHGVFEGSKPVKNDQKKRKNFMKSHSARSYDLGTDSAYGHCATGPQQHMLMGKRPATNLNVGSIPIKRMRTASRQRFTSPFTAGTSGGLQNPMKTDASSGDTSSFQDDQSTLHGGSQFQKSMEVESSADFERQLPYDCAETSTKPKKKKAKHLGSAYEQGWQLDSTVHNEQRDNSKKRLEGHYFDSNGTSGLYGQHTAKKPKLAKQLLDNTFDNMAQMTGSIPSPAASQMSNMSNTSRFIKLIGGRDRSRKNKSTKMSSGQPGSGSPWSVYEDQALVVLVHDMGPNWELISDAINSTLQFKCIFRKPKECKERHKSLMDKGAGDGADSAEDSGSSQSYPSTLPGIPKGSARQLFQHLQGPMQEDTLKSHFEKIIMIGKRQHCKRSQNDNQDPKQIAPPHNSHNSALSQARPNYLNGVVLTPLDLCDPAASNPDVLPMVYQGSHASNLVMPNQGAVASILPTSGTSSSLQGSSGVVLGNNSSSPSGPLSTPNRDGRYNVPRTSLPLDEQHRLQHYNQMLSNRNLQQSNLSVSGALPGADRGVRVLPSGNGMGMMSGMNRSMPLPRPAFQGIASSSLLSSGSMLSSSMVGMPSPVNLHSGTGSGQGNSMRPREAMHMMRPGHNPEHQRQMMVPELQMQQATQGNNQGIPAFNGLSSAFPNQTTPPPVQTYPGHPQQQHQLSPQQSNMLSNPHHPNLHGNNHPTGSQQYAICLAKERQMRQRMLQQQHQQQFAASNNLMPHVQHQSQLPISSSMQNSSQIPPQTVSQPVSLPPVTPPSPMTPISMQQQQQQKHNLQHHALSRNPQTGSSGLTNQMGKQRQRQPQQFQQSGRHHPQQRQHSQSPQQAKLLKGMGRGNMVHQNLPVDHSPLNGLSMSPGNQGAEKGEQIMHLMPGQGLYSGTGLSPIQSSKPSGPSQPPNHSQPQQKLYSGPTTPSSKHQQIPSQLDNSAQGQVPPVPSGLTATHQNTPVIVPNHQHLQPHPLPLHKQVNQPQPTVQRILQQNRQLNSDVSTKHQTDQGNTDQQTPNNVPQTGTGASTAIPQACKDSANLIPVVSATQWKPSESPLHDSVVINVVSHVGPIGSPPMTSSTGSETVAPVNQGSGQRQSSGGLPLHGHDTGAQWQQPQLQQSTSSPPPSQQLLQPQEQLQQELQQSPQQLPPQPQSQQQTQHLQSTQGSLYIRPSNSSLE